MKPKYFALTPWDWTPRVSCAERRFQIEGELPADYEGTLSFHSGIEGRSWHDVIQTTIGVLLFSEKVVKAFEADDIVGMTFYEARISKVENPRLRKKQPPNYFWGRAKGLISIDPELDRQFRRAVPIRVEESDNSEVFHLIRPNRSPAGYVCTMRVLETSRTHRIGNLYIWPLDYYRADKMDFSPPFRIDVLAKQWPPESWYPDGFVPHPNNLTDD